MYRRAVRHRRRGGAGRRPRRGGHRRRAGQDHDRGAADEDGRRRGALRRPSSRRRSRCSPSAASTAAQEKFAVKLPDLLSFLATGNTDGKVEGINELRAQYQKTYGSDPGATYYSAGDYTPVIPVTYWSFRLMIGLGLVAAAGRGAGAVG